MKKKFFLGGLVLAVGLAGCTGGPKQTGGSLLGAGAGALIGSQFGGGTGQLVGVAAGTLLGAWAGGSIGASLDAEDQRAANSAASRAFENNRSGERAEWRNPDSGHHGYILPTKTYRDNYGRNCREFTQTIYVGRDKKEAYGTACRDANGDWQIVSTN